MPKPYRVFWTERALKNAKEISDWIMFKFSKKEVERFFRLLEDFEKVVGEFPDIYPVSQKKPDIRQAVVHKNLSIYYSFEKEVVAVLAIRDNRQESTL